MKLWQKGLIVFLVGGLFNAVLMRAEVHGLLRELGRLSILIGLALMIVGAVRRK